jgi:hypothetical protein
VYGVAAGRLSPGGFPKFVNKHLALLDMASFDAHSLSTVLWSYTMLGERLPGGVLERMEAEIVHRGFEGFSALDVSFTLGSLAQTRNINRLLFQQINTELLHRLSLEDFNSRALAGILYSFSVAGVPCTVFANRVCAILSGRRKDKQLDASLHIKLLYSLACLDVLNEPAVSEYFQRTLKVTVDRSDASTAFQLLQADSAWRQRHKNPAKGVDVVMHEYKAWALDVVTPGIVVPSFTRDKAIQTLSSKFKDIQVNVQVIPGVFVDVVVPSLNLAVLFNLPTRYTACHKHVLGSTLFQYRLIKQAGFQLAVVDLKRFGLYSADDQEAMMVKFASQVTKL